MLQAAVKQTFVPARGKNLFTLIGDAIVGVELKVVTYFTFTKYK